MSVIFRCAWKNNFNKHMYVRSLIRKEAPAAPLAARMSFTLFYDSKAILDLFR